MALGYQNLFYLKQAQKKQQSLYDGKVLLEKHDPPIMHDSKETLQLAQESREKMKQMNKKIKPANYTKINHLSGVFVPQTALSREELYFSNNSKTANVSKSISIPNEDFSDDTTPSVECKFLNEKQQSLYDGKVLLEKHDPPVVHDSEETLQLAQESRVKMKQMNKEIKPTNYTKINHLSGVFVLQTALSHEELYFSDNSKTTNVSKSISIPNEDFSNDTTPSVAHKFLNEVKSTIVTLQCVVKQRMTIETHNWASSAHQELYKIIKDENFLIVNQVDAKLQNFKIQFLKEAAKFVGDFKSLANEADASLAKHKALELEIERLLKAVVSQDIMIIVQNESVVDTSDVQTELESYKDMQQKIKRLQAQLRDLKGKIKDTSSVSDTRNPLSPKLENENVELEFQVLNYARENAHLKATYKNLTTLATSENTKFAKQPIVENLPKVGKTNALSNPVTSNSVSTPQEPKSVNNDKVIAPGMFRINPSKISKEEKHVLNTVSASTKTKLITISQPPIISKKDVNSDLNGLSSTRIDNTKTRRPHPKSNTKHDRVPSASKSSRSKNKEAEVEEHIGIYCFLRITNIYHRHVITFRLILKM
nr:hypothetical protein [Tanacetum cinerariifolium]